MSKTILFSPVGGTDPISAANFKDGSLLHICRVYQPDEVIMYMSKEIIEFHEKDNRYEYCLDRLGEMIGKKMEYKYIMRPDLVEVQNYDYYYTEFAAIIKDIFSKMGKKDKLLINVSSGTPSMKSGLLVLQTLGEYPCVSVQVATPTRKMGEHTHTNYDVETLWELDEDNAPDFENRCTEVACLNLSRIKNEEIIKKHILAYDYSAALAVADTMPKEYTEGYYLMLKMAFHRNMLDFVNMDKCLARCSYKLPIKSGDARKYVEYALELDVKLKRKQYADFIRAISPLLVDLYDQILKSYLNINLDDYCIKQGNSRIWDAQKLKDTDVLSVLSRAKGYFTEKNVYGSHLVELIKGLAGDSEVDKTLKTLVDQIRNVEKEIRNTAAHQIVMLDDAEIKRKSGYDSKQIMDMIKSLFMYTSMADLINEKTWKSYDEMNQKIISLIG